MQHLKGHLSILKNILDKIKGKVNFDSSLSKEEICKIAEQSWIPWNTCPTIERTASYTAVIMARILKSTLLEDGCSKDELAHEMSLVLKDCSEEDIKGTIDLLVEMGELTEYGCGNVRR